MKRRADVAVLAVLAVLVGGGSVPAQPMSAIKIGLLMPGTGPFTVNAQRITTGVRLFFREPQPGPGRVRPGGSEGRQRVPQRVRGQGATARTSGGHSVPATLDSAGTRKTSANKESQR